jgi:hypothetical protein
MKWEWTGAARVRISGGRGGPIERAVWPTPYEAELLAEDLAHAGRGACVEIDVDGLAPGAIAAIESSVCPVFARHHAEVRWSGRPPAEPEAPPA